MMLDSWIEPKSRLYRLVDSLKVPSWLWLLVPSFIQSYFAEPSSEKPHVRPTAWLDGLRGWASLIVFFFHFNQNYHPWTSWGYGYEIPNFGPNTVVFSLPGLKVFTAGTGMVTLFFIVSGYSLAFGPVKEIHAGSTSNCHRKLASSILRRPIRLMLPPIIVTVLVLVCVQLGFYTWSWQHYQGWSYMGLKAAYPPMDLNLCDQIIDLYRQTSKFVWAISFDNYNAIGHTYNPALWTIVLEFRWSLILFLVIFGVSQTRFIPRVALYCAFIGYCFYYIAWDGILFIVGALLTEYTWYQHSLEHRIALTDNNEDCEQGHLLAEVNENDQRFFYDWLPTQKTKKAVYSFKEPLIFLVFAFGLHLLAAPEEGQDSTFGWAFLYNTFAPVWWKAFRPRFLQVVGSILAFASVLLSKHLQRFFSNTFSRYLGRISYALYLTHVPMLYMCGHFVIPNFWKITYGPFQPPDIPGETSDPRRAYIYPSIFGYELGIVLGTFILFPAIFVVADLFTRAVDEPLVNLARKFESSIIVTNER